MRRKAAREHDKTRIRQLEQRLLVLEGALSCWQQWYWMRVAEDEPEGGESRQAAQVHSGPAVREPQRASVIDYSKWDTLDCSSDEEEQAKGDERDAAECGENAYDGYWGLEGEDQEEGKEEHDDPEEEEKDDKEEDGDFGELDNYAECYWDATMRPKKVRKKKKKDKEKRTRMEAIRLPKQSPLKEKRTQKGTMAKGRSEKRTSKGRQRTPSALNRDASR